MKSSRLLAVYAPLFAVAAGWGLARLAGFEGLRLLGWLPGALGIAIGGGYLLLAARTPGLDPAGRRFWRQIAVAALLIAPATQPLTEASLGGHKTGPILTGAVVLLSVALVLVLWALLRLPARSRSRGDWLRLGLDGATVLVCSASFLWHFVLRPLVDARIELPKALGMLVLSVLCLLAVLAVVKLILVGTEAVDVRALQALALVVLIGAVGSALVPVLRSPRLAGVSDLITVAEAVMVGVAGVLQSRRAASVPAAARHRRPYSVLPYFAVAAVNLLLVAVMLSGVGALPVLVGAVVATGAVVARQLLALRDNDGLLKSLREHQRLLHEQATHDALTGLPNRTLFNERLESATAAILIDLDDFKAVNDTLGHPVGDGLLIEAGRRLRAAVRPADLVARLGGDEFAILVTDLVDDTPGGRHLDALAVRILRELAAPVRSHGHVLAVTASVGVAARQPGDGAQDLLRHADIAMYAAKKRGKGTYARYTPDLSGLLMTPESRLADLRRAISRARAPFVLEVGRAALVSPGFAGELAGLLDEAGLAPAGLTVALPAAQLADDEAVARAMRELRSAGVGLALDHSGTGTVRLDLLAALPFTALIVDRDFGPPMDDLGLAIDGDDDAGPRDARSRAFAEAVSRFARDAGIDYRVRYEGALQESAL
ncbi:diguanylate cyclase domain-containing protein [Dactylosporangium darangshiense]|uniref:Bifunctional diguanylate cyclase/phosphodiesterase n=1 Tax=Dactylosporangium darangshiense TaxID=579108 RepID=A0ABP8DN61_9ACTN